ncbi:MAG: glutamate--tRNA ligase [Proteobacteria bacterium]|nr:glutamate--tRNA ligase [Pseudomonadota bacterium]
MVITRFAPSPTGDLHIGSARTALFCWLWAKNQGGKFILRVEDTDRERSTEQAVQVILDGLTWLGLKWDEGPIFQTQRFSRYKEVAKQLLADGHAYRCYCTKERLEVLRDKQIAAKEKPRYDRYCLRFPHPPHDDMPYVIRFKTPQTGSLSFNDLVKGPIEVQNSELDDLILVRSDGTPTYNFTVVVDDWEMNITHVLRGDDHINNTPRQIHILQALGAKIPQYGHMPMLLGPDGKKLSKREGAASVLEYRAQGILPEALVNYLVRLGWSYGDQEIFSQDEMIKLFNVLDINSAASAINPEKLLWLNQHYLKTKPPAEIARELAWHLEKSGIELSKGPSLEEIVLVQRERCKTLVEMAQKSEFLFQDEVNVDESFLNKYFTQEVFQALALLIEKLTALANWQPELINQTVKEVAEQLSMKLGLIAQPIRIAVTGSTVSPSIDATLFLLGKEKSLNRLAQAIELKNELYSKRVDSHEQEP